MATYISGMSQLQDLLRRQNESLDRIATTLEKLVAKLEELDR